MDGLPHYGSMLRGVDYDCRGEAGQHRRAPEILPAARATTSARGPDDELRARLSRTIEAEIIPRLMQVHRSEAPAPAVNAAQGWLPGAAEVAEFTGIVLAEDPIAALGYVESLRAGGASLEMLCRELLAPAARRLGDLWAADESDFTQVTVGLLTLHRVLRELGPGFPSGFESAERGLAVLLVPPPGEFHTFGIAMVAEFFRRAGWSVCGSPPGSLAELREQVRSRWYDVAGLTVSCDSRLEPLASCIRELRAASRNPGIGVMVGGPLFVGHPERVLQVGADTMVVDGWAAPLRAEYLLARLAQRRLG